MTQRRKAQFYLDSAAGTLTEYTSDLNQVSLERMVEILDNTHLNEDDKSKVSGLRDAKLPINGFMDDSSTALSQVIDAAQGTSTSKTFQLKIGSRYWNGECFPADYKPSADGKKLAVFSATLEVDGAINRTTVAVS